MVLSKMVSLYLIHYHCNTSELVFHAVKLDLSKHGSNAMIVVPILEIVCRSLVRDKTEAIIKCSGIILLTNLCSYLAVHKRCDRAGCTNGRCDTISLH